MLPIRALRRGACAFSIPVLAAACVAPSHAPKAQRVFERSSQLLGAGSTEPESGPLCDLEEIVAQGLRADAGLAAAYARYRSAAERPLQERALPDPRLTWVEFVEELQTRSGPNRRRFQFEQRFPFPGVRSARSDASFRAAEVLLERAHAMAAGVRLEIEQAWYELRYALAREASTQSTLVLLESLIPIVQRRVEAGGSREDMLRLEIELLLIRNERASAQQRLVPLRSELAAAASVDQSAILDPGIDSEEPLEELDRELLHGLALSNNPALLVASAQQSSARSAHALSKTAGRPELGLGILYLDVGDALLGGAADSGQDPWAVSLSMSLPVWRSSYSAAQREAQQAVIATERLVEEELKRIEARFERIWFEIEDAQRLVALHRDQLLPRARETYDWTLSAYSASQSSLTDLILAERQILDLELGMRRAVRDSDRARAQLNALIGGARTK